MALDIALHGEVDWVGYHRPVVRSNAHARYVVEAGSSGVEAGSSGRYVPGWSGAPFTVDNIIEKLKLACC